jgi:hypothetical protein
MVSLSVKELREQLPFVRSELKKGTSFLIIYQSKPIAKLSPVDDLSDLEEATDEDIELAAMADFNSGENSEDEFLTKTEIAHYMSLR